MVAPLGPLPTSHQATSEGGWNIRGNPVLALMLIFRFRASCEGLIGRVWHLPLPKGRLLFNWSGLAILTSGSWYSPRVDQKG